MSHATSYYVRQKKLAAGNIKSYQIEQSVEAKSANNIIPTEPLPENAYRKMKENRVTLFSRQYNALQCNAESLSTSVP